MAQLMWTARTELPPRDAVRHLARWAARSCPFRGDVLNVGAGADLSGSLHPLLLRRARIVGVDPDPALDGNPHVQERHRMTVEEFAADHAAKFDVVLSVFVLEHVERPEEFARACLRVLRPGGSWFALTLNIQHYFGGTVWALSRLHLAHPVLHLLKGDELVEEHHFPTRYRFNSQSAVLRHCGAAGFEAVDFHCYDAPGRYEWYLPAALRWFPGAYSRAAYTARLPGLMGHLSFRAIKPAGVTGAGARQPVEAAADRPPPAPRPAGDRPRRTVPS
jgi:SAM-dependent methyltransferase